MPRLHLQQLPAQLRVAARSVHEQHERQAMADKALFFQVDVDPDDVDERQLSLCMHAGERRVQLEDAQWVEVGLMKDLSFGKGGLDVAETEEDELDCRQLVAGGEVATQVSKIRVWVGNVLEVESDLDV